MTRVVYEKPPVWDAAVAAFGPLPYGVIFAWDDRIYEPNGDGSPLAPALIAHETIHFGQQAAMGGASAWWERYIADPRFRLEQEVEAHRAEFAWWADASRKVRRRQLSIIAKRLASSMYGNLLTRDQAAKVITGHCPLP